MIDWTFMGDKAWLASEVAIILGVKPVTARIYLKKAEGRRILVSKPWGRYKYYMLRSAYNKQKKERDIENGILDERNTKESSPMGN